MLGASRSMALQLQQQPTTAPRCGKTVPRRSRINFGIGRSSRACQCHAALETRPRTAAAPLHENKSKVVELSPLTKVITHACLEHGTLLYVCGITRALPAAVHHSINYIYTHCCSSSHQACMHARAWMPVRALYIYMIASFMDAHTARSSCR
jgi:hypothetical protein